MFMCQAQALSEHKTCHNCLHSNTCSHNIYKDVDIYINKICRYKANVNIRAKRDPVQSALQHTLHPR